MKKIHFEFELQERLASFSWWVFKIYYLPNIQGFTREDWEDIRQEIYLLAFAIPLMGMPQAGDKKTLYRPIHSTLHSVLKRMGFIKPRGKSAYIKNFYIERQRKICLGGCYVL